MKLVKYLEKYVPEYYDLIQKLPISKTFFNFSNIIGKILYINSNFLLKKNVLKNISYLYWFEIQNIISAFRISTDFYKLTQT